MAASSRSSRKASRDPAPKRYGSTTPRVFTPPLRPLEPRTPETEQNTLGYSVIDFAEHILKITLLPWQCWLLVHMLELRPDNTLRFRTVVVLVARQNGKSTLSQVLALWMMYVYGLNLVLGTAQDLDTAEEVWQARSTWSPTSTTRPTSRSALSCSTCSTRSSRSTARRRWSSRTGSGTRSRPPTAARAAVSPVT